MSKAALSFTRFPGFGHMSETNKNLAAVYQRNGHAAEDNDPRVISLAAKLDLLKETRRYQSLLGNLFGASDPANLQSLLLEAVFAFQFESAGKPLQYEAKQRDDDNTSIDFLRQLPSDNKLYIEMRLLQQSNWITGDIAEQVEFFGGYAVTLDGEQDKKEVLRLQRTVLEKAQDKHGRPIKFAEARDRQFNVIAVEVSELQLGMVDLDDCLLVTYGDPAVHRINQRGVVGLFQQVDASYPQQLLEAAKMFEAFRSNIHGVLFLWKTPPGPADFELQYFLACNRALMSAADAELVETDLRAALAIYQRPKPNYGG